MTVKRIYFDDQQAIDAVRRDWQDEQTRAQWLREYSGHGKTKKGDTNLAALALEDAPAREALFANVAIRRRVARDFSQPFEHALSSEHKRRKWQLGGMKRFMDGHGHSIDPDATYEKMGVGLGRVMSANPIVLPYHGAEIMDYDSTNKNNGIELMTLGKDVTIDGLHYNLGFWNQWQQDASENDRLSYIPAILLDPKVMGALQDLGRDGDAKLRKAAGRLLPSMQLLFTVGMHDYVHHMFFPPRKYGENRADLVAPDVLLENHQQLPVSDAWYDNQAFDMHATRGKINGVLLLELQAELFNRDLWRDTFRNQPRVKDNIIRTATQFITDLETVRGALAESRGGEFAASVANYMVSLTMSRLLRVVDVTDPDLAKPLRLARGGQVSFIEACNRLQLPPVILDNAGIAAWKQQIRLTNLIHESLETEEPRLVTLFAARPELFPKLSKSEGVSLGSKGANFTVECRGFEAVVARTFMSDTHRLNRAALMYDFDEGNDPRLRSANIVADIDRALHENLPPELEREIARYQQAALQGIRQRSVGLGAR